MCFLSFRVHQIVCANFRANQFPCPAISMSGDFCVRRFARPSICASVDFRVRQFPRQSISASVDFGVRAKDYVLNLIYYLVPLQISSQKLNTFVEEYVCTCSCAPAFEMRSAKEQDNISNSKHCINAMTSYQFRVILGLTILSHCINFELLYQF